MSSGGHPPSETCWPADSACIPRSCAELASKVGILRFEHTASAAANPYFGARQPQSHHRVARAILGIQLDLRCQPHCNAGYRRFVPTENKKQFDAARVVIEEDGWVCTACAGSPAKRVQVKLPTGERMQWSIAHNKDVQAGLNVNKASGGMLVDPKQNPPLLTNKADDLQEGVIYEVWSADRTSRRVQGVTISVPGDEEDVFYDLTFLSMNQADLTRLLDRLSLAGVLLVGGPPGFALQCHVDDLESGAKYVGIPSPKAPLKSKVVLPNGGRAHWPITSAPREFKHCGVVKAFGLWQYIALTGSRALGACSYRQPCPDHGIDILHYEGDYVVFLCLMLSCRGRWHA